MTVNLYVRKPITVNTDPQRRCYDGCNFSETTVWSEWALIRKEFMNKRVVPYLHLDKPAYW